MNKPNERRVEMEPAPPTSRPDPDPTLATNQQSDKAILCLREVLEARLDGMDKAIQLLQVSTDKFPDSVKRSVMQLQELHDQRISGEISVVNEKITSLSNVTTQQFTSIKDTFSEKDKAVSVGLSAQKESAAATQLSNTEATTKMEDNFTKLLDQGREMLTEIRRNTELQINDLKSGQSLIAARLDKGEGKTSVSDPATTELLRSLRDEIKSLGTTRDLNKGVSDGSAKTSASTGLIVGLSISGAVAFVVMMTAIVGVVAFITSRAPNPSMYQPPQANIR